MSIYWGILIVQKSKGDANEIASLINAAGDPNAGAAGPGAGGSANARTNSNAGRKRRANNPYEDV